MTVDEVPTRLRARLEQEYGVDEASILMDRPPGGWGDLATHESVRHAISELEHRVDLRFEALEARMDARFTEVERRFDAVDHRFDRFEHELLSQVDRRLRGQTWVTITTVVGAMGVIAALVKL